MNIEIIRLTHSEKVPMDLLLQADPSEEMINKYLPESEIFVAKNGSDIVGTFVLLATSEDEMELKNISVKKEYQRKGIGKAMIKQAVRITKMEDALFLIAKTADSSVGQQNFYRKMKFDEYYTVKGFYIKYYQQPIVEDGVEAVDQIAFRRPV